MKNDWFVTGDGTIKIRLRRGGRRGNEAVWTEIDASDFSLVDAYPGTWISKWNPTAGTFYARHNPSFGCKGRYMHRVIMGVRNPRVWVDHRDHNGLNNRRSTNLSLSNVRLNGFNRRGAEVGSTSGRRNVYWNARENKWMVWFVHNGKRYYFGYFSDIEEADQVAKRERERFNS